MAVAVDGWAAARGVVETKHNGELVCLALAKCLPWFCSCYIVQSLFGNPRIMAYYVLQGFQAFDLFFFIGL